MFTEEIQEILLLLSYSYSYSYSYSSYCHRCCHHIAPSPVSDPYPSASVSYPYPYPYHHHQQQQQHLQPTTNQTLAPIKNLGVPTRFYRTKGALCFSNHFYWNELLYHFTSHRITSLLQQAQLNLFKAMFLMLVDLSSWRNKR